MIDLKIHQGWQHVLSDFFIFKTIFQKSVSSDFSLELKDLTKMYEVDQPVRFLQNPLPEAIISRPSSLILHIFNFGM